MFAMLRMPRRGRIVDFVIMGNVVDTGFGKQAAQTRGRKHVNDGVEEGEENGENKTEMSATWSSLARRGSCQTYCPPLSAFMRVWKHCIKATHL
jgi:hypothetical protein